MLDFLKVTGFFGFAFVFIVGGSAVLPIWLLVLILRKLLKASSPTTPIKGFYHDNRTLAPLPEHPSYPPAGYYRGKK